MKRQQYISAQELGEKWGISKRRVNQLCVDGRIPGAQKVGQSWTIPADVRKPAGLRAYPKEKAWVGPKPIFWRPGRLPSRTI